MDCESRLRIVLAPPLTKPGAYSVQLTVDGQKSLCRVMLDDEGIHVISPHTPACAGLGSGLPKKSMDELVVSGAPRKVNVDVVHSGRNVARAALVPRYVPYRPNGEGCPPVCEVGTETVVSGAGER